MKIDKDLFKIERGNDFADFYVKFWNDSANIHDCYVDTIDLKNLKKMTSMFKFFFKKEVGCGNFYNNYEVENFLSQLPKTECHSSTVNMYSCMEQSFISRVLDNDRHIFKSYELDFEYTYYNYPDLKRFFKFSASFYDCYYSPLTNCLCFFYKFLDFSEYEDKGHGYNKFIRSVKDFSLIEEVQK